MKILVWLSRLFILLVLVWFSVKNSEEIVTLHAYPYSWHAPLVLVIFAFFSGGVMLGLLASLGSIYRLKRELGVLKKVARQKANERADEKAIAAGSASQSSGIGNNGV